MIKSWMNSSCLFLVVCCVNFALGNDDALLQGIKANVLAAKGGVVIYREFDEYRSPTALY